eukprot:2397106-Rhodomonas_salina.1
MSAVERCRALSSIITLSLVIVKCHDEHRREASRQMASLSVIIASVIAEEHHYHRTVLLSWIVAMTVTAECR